MFRILNLLGYWLLGFCLVGFAVFHSGNTLAASIVTGYDGKVVGTSPLPEGYDTVMDLKDHVRRYPGQTITPSGSGGVSSSMATKAVVNSSNSQLKTELKAPITSTRTATPAKVAAGIAGVARGSWPVAVSLVVLPEVLNYVGYKMGDGAKAGEIVLDGKAPKPATGEVEISFGATWVPEDQGQAACQAAASNYYSGHGGLKEAKYTWSTYYSKPYCGVICNDGWNGGGFGSSRTAPPACPTNSTLISGTTTCLCDGGYFEDPSSTKQVCRLPADTPPVVVDPVKIEAGLAANAPGIADLINDLLAKDVPFKIEISPVENTGSPSHAENPVSVKNSPVKFPDGSPVMSGGKQVEATTSKKYAVDVAPNGSYIDVVQTEETVTPTVTTSGDQVTVTTTTTTTTTTNNTVNSTTTTVNNYYTTTNNNTTTPNNPPTKTDTSTKTEAPVETPPPETTTVQDSPLPPVPDLYEQKYPDGMAGAWNTRSAEIKATPLVGLIAGLSEGAPDGGSCPSWSIDGSVLGISTAGNFAPPCYLWGVGRVIVLLMALILARRAIFGG